jgi:DNA repair exonuclease SbcCD ATPase subunit
MNHLKFRYAKAINTLCFGEQGIELHFTDYGNIVQITGVNLDNPGTDDNPASNASGKSSLQEVISLGLYGKTIKSPKKNKIEQIVNSQANAGTIVLELDDLRIERVFKRKGANKLKVWRSKDHIWDDDTDISKGAGIGDTQKIIDGHVGLDHHSFCTVCVFDDSNAYSFLEAEKAADKRKIVENLLGLDKYREYSKSAKDLLKEAKDRTDALAREYSRLQADVDDCETRIVHAKGMEEQWRGNKKNAMKTLMGNLKKLQDELMNFSAAEAMASYKGVQDQTAELTEKQADYHQKRTKLAEVVADARKKLSLARDSKQPLSLDVTEKANLLSEIRSAISKSEELMKQLNDLEDGAVCPTCHGIISKDNYGVVMRREKNTLAKAESSLLDANRSLEAAKKKFGDRAVAIDRIERGLQDAESKLSILENQIEKNQKDLSSLAEIPKPEVASREDVLESEITQIKKQLKEKREEYENDSPYTEIIEQAVVSKNKSVKAAEDKTSEVEAAEAELPYLEYWVKAFGDNGIRRLIVDGIVPALNSRIAYWMQYLIDGCICLTFDNKLQETILRNGNDAYYSNSSNGEQRRINLAVSQAFAYVMMLNCGKCPSLVFLDEITGGGIDKVGVIGVYNMIFELAKDRQVFVTTHNEHLSQMLQGCEKIHLRKSNDVTVLAGVK